MYVKRNYSFWMTFNWSKGPFIWGLLFSALVVGLEYVFGISLALPWQPISIVGIAVAFYLGFKNNSSYDRTWEARKIWGGIVNDSRTFGMAVMAFVSGEGKEEVQQELIYRHLAWLTALRFQLRLSRPWEHTEERMNDIYAPTICEKYNNKLEPWFEKLLPDSERTQVMEAANTATQILKTQGVRLQELRNQNRFEDFRHMEFHQLMANFYAGQGKAERIKNFPFPRQYASTAVWLTYVFCALVPFGLVDVFGIQELSAMVACSLCSGLIIWIFFLMEKIGDYSENPFEGTYNDVPITTISYGIATDLFEMLGQTNFMPKAEEKNGFVM